MSTQLRYVVRPGGYPVLQFRQGHITKSTTGIIGLESIKWGEWRGVPIVVESDTHQAPALPEGYVMVPVEPTEGMLEAAHDTCFSDPSFRNLPGRDKGLAVYKAMIAASKEGQ